VRFTKAGKVVRDVEDKLMPTSLAEVARAAGETFWEVCQYWDTQWQGWLQQWAHAMDGGTGRKPSFHKSWEMGQRYFRLGDRMDNIKKFNAKVKGDAVYAAADKVWRASLN